MIEQDPTTEGFSIDGISQANGWGKQNICSKLEADLPLTDEIQMPWEIKITEMITNGYYRGFYENGNRYIAHHIVFSTVAYVSFDLK